MPRTGSEDLADLLHADVRGEGRHIRVVNRRVSGGVVVFVLRERAPHATVDAVS